MQARIYWISIISIIFNIYISTAQNTGYGSGANANYGNRCDNPVLITLHPECSNDANNPGPGSQYGGHYQFLVGTAGSYYDLTGNGNNVGAESTCAGTDANDDVVWARVCPNSTSITITNQTSYTGPAGNSAIEYTLFTGSCGALSQFTCGTITKDGTAVITGLTAGQCYTVMLSKPDAIAAANLINACFTSNDATVSNPYDDCSSPLIATTGVIYDLNVVNATFNSAQATNMCGTGSIENDIWVKWCGSISLTV